MRLNSAVQTSGFADELPVAHKFLRDAKLSFRRGEVSLTAGASTVGKSQWWHNLADNLVVKSEVTGEQLPTLYWAADMIQQDATERTLMHRGDTDVETAKLRMGTDWASEHLAEGAKHIEWAFESQITPELLVVRLDAYATVYGSYPPLLVVDTIANATDEPSMESAAQQGVMRFLQEIAKDGNIHVAALTHVRREYANGDNAIPMNGIRYNIAFHAAVGVTIHWLQNPKLLAFNVVKNRSGAPSDTAAERPYRVKVDYSRATVMGFGE